MSSERPLAHETPLGPQKRDEMMERFKDCHPDSIAFFGLPLPSAYLKQPSPASFSDDAERMGGEGPYPLYENSPSRQTKSAHL